MSPTCEYCHYSRPFGSSAAIMCCRYPPTITKVEEQSVTSHFPLVNIGAWCGEWKQKRKRDSKPILDMARSESDQAIPSTEGPPLTEGPDERTHHGN